MVHVPIAVEVQRRAGGSSEGDFDFGEDRKGLAGGGDGGGSGGGGGKGGGEVGRGERGGC